MLAPGESVGRVGFAGDRRWEPPGDETEITRASKSRRKHSRPNADHAAAAARLEDVLSKATGSGIRARPHRDGYQLLLDKQAADRLVELLAPRPDEL